MISAKIVAACLALSAPNKPGYVLETAQPPRPVEAALTFEIQAPGLAANEWVAFVAQPMDLPGQSHTSLEIKPTGKPIRDLSPLHRPMLLVRQSALRSSRRDRLTVTATYKATLHARRLRVVEDDALVQSSVAALEQRDRDLALARTDHFDFDAQTIRDWMKDNDLLRSDDECDIDLARRIFNTIKSNFEYDYKPELDRRASAVCQSMKSDCGGLSVLFATALRANGVPARVLVGRWAQSANQGQKLGGVPYYQAHVKAEFFADGVGWAPVDMASAILHDRNGNSARYFGNDPGDFITMHIDPDVMVDTIHFGKKQTPWMQGVTFWVTGQGSLTNLKTTESWIVK